MAATTSSSTHEDRQVTATVGRRALAGVIGGVSGGIVFGILMAMMGMLPMIASIVGSNSPVIGFGIHIMISILIGLGLTVLFGNLLLTSYPRGIVVGIVYGAIWWLLGPLVIMPMMFGMDPFTVDATTLPSLMGHLIYGAILGAVAVGIITHRR